MLDGFNLEEFNFSPNLRKSIKKIVCIKITIFLLFSIFESIWSLNLLDAQIVCIRQMKEEYINKGEKSAHQKAVNFCNGGG